MNSIHLTKDHYSIVTIKDIGEICNPFFEKYGLTGFMHARFFNDNTAYILCSHRDYYLHHYEKSYQMCPIVLPSNNSKKFFHIVTQNNDSPFSQVYHDARNLFGFDYILYLIERFQGYFDMYVFGTTPENHNILNFYINNFNIFEHFKFYFKDKAAKLIKHSAQNKIIVPEHLQPGFKGFATYPTLLSKSDNKLHVKRYYLSGKNEGTFLSRREYESINLLKNGYSAKEIAKHMSLSPRTVENHLNNIKNKLNLQKKSEILSILTELGLL